MSTSKPKAAKAKARTADPKKKRAAKSKPPLLFIDTNILLDFYRTQNDAGISLLAKIDSLQEQVITTCQVEMEFKKNRQKVMRETVSLLKAPDFSLSTPAFLSDAANVKVIKGRIKDVKNRVERLKARVLATLENPKTHDRIYQAAQRLFNRVSPLNLRYGTSEYKQVWRKALRRFLEGRPPRKKDDTSAGDAVNWEWIVHCIEKTNRDVIIVSRDADYGLNLDAKGYANNWLSDEVKERVNQQRKLVLVDRLSVALKLLEVAVTPAEIASESATITSALPLDSSELAGAVEDALFSLLHGEDVGSLIGATNTSGWVCDTYNIERTSHRDGVWFVQVSFDFSGKQQDDKPWTGNQISGTCTMKIDRERTIDITEFDAKIKR